MKRTLLILALLVAVSVAVFLATRRSAPPDSPFAKAKTETLVSVLSTNGKTEPVEWAPVHAERAGRISRIAVTRGQSVAAGTVLALLEDGATAAMLASAQARLEQARAEVATLERGGRAAELADIETTLQRIAAERAAAQRELAALERLVAKQAAPRAELDIAKDRLAQLDAQATAQQIRRKALVGQGDLTVAQARVRDAEAAIAQARRQMELASIRAPRAGVVYDLPAREGAWLEAGGLVARIGEMARLRVTVYIDEPDLGRVKKGLPVTVTWDALQGREWLGVVDQVPAQVIALGTRQVGEVVTVADNPKLDLPPGANINARIRAQVVEGALTIPKAALRRENGELGVFVLQSGRVAWRPVQVGISSETRAEIRSGLKSGDLVALPSDRSLAVGQELTPTEQ
ncbi:MAG: efflux RND transporter periplasmic adaptor subunit [Bryobacterales bacterium]|nr:efflux RND transporter periplasmic adaptor subunit [Bryobacterales bacterium]